jgi:hypothetical protein
MTRSTIFILSALLLMIVSCGAARTPVASNIQDVKSFGAKGNGKDDDAAAIQRAINALPATGGSVFFPSGVYRTSASLTVPQYVQLRGEGSRASVIEYTGAGFAVVLGATSSKSLIYGTGVSDMAIRLTSSSGNGITMQGTAGALVANIYLEGIIPNNSTAVFVDGGNAANLFTALTNIIANHFKTGFRLGSTGSSATTSVVATNINSFGDVTYGAKDSIGIQIDETHGQGSRFYGGNMESCATGIYGRGIFVLIDGMRFEGNKVDVALDNPAAAWLITGCMGLTNFRNNSPKNQFTRSFKQNLDPISETSAEGSISNLLHLTATSTWDPPRLVDGGVASTVIDVAGARVGDTLAIGFSQSVPGGALLVGAVTAPNVVTCTLLNKTGRPLDLGPGNLRVDVWQH